MIEPARRLARAAHCDTTCTPNAGPGSLDPGSKGQAVHSHSVALAGDAHFHVPPRVGADVGVVGHSGRVGGRGRIAAGVGADGVGVVDQRLCQLHAELGVRLGPQALPLIHLLVDEVCIRLRDAYQGTKHALLPVVGPHSILDRFWSKCQFVESINVPELVSVDAVDVRLVESVSSAYDSFPGLVVPNEVAEPWLPRRHRPRSVQQCHGLLIPVHRPL